MEGDRNLRANLNRKRRGIWNRKGERGRERKRDIKRQIESPSVILNNKAPSAPSPLSIRYLDNHLLSLEATVRHNGEVIHPGYLPVKRLPPVGVAGWSSNRLLYFRPARISSFSYLVVILGVSGNCYSAL